MKISMMTNNYKPVVGGVPIAIERLADGLRKRGHLVYIFAPEYQGQEDQEEEFVIRYRAFHKKAGGYVPLMKPVDLAMERKFRELKFDIIHVHHPVLIGQRARYLGKKYGVPVVFTYHTQYEQYLHYWKHYRWLKKRGGILEDKMVDFIENQLVLAVIRRFTEKCSLVFAPTNQVERILKGRGWEANTTVMPTGLPDFSYEEYWRQIKEYRLSVEYIRKIYGKERTNILCTVARLSEEKNLKFLLRSLGELKERMGNDFQLLIIGDGPQKQELEQYAHELDILENITFLGTVPNEEIAAFHCASDLFLFASKSETQGIVLLEAMAGKSPVVAVKATGVCDVVRNGQNGYMTEEREEAFAEKIQQLLCDSELYNKLVEGAGDTAWRYRNEAVSWMAEYSYERVILAQKGHKNVFTHS